MILGHEIAGVVTRIGPKVTRYKMGNRVTVRCFVDSCRKCGPCPKGLKQYCMEGPTLTYNAVQRDRKNRTQGGHSNKIIVDENYVLRIPENIPMNRAAPLLCACITMYSPLMHWKVDCCYI
jgi:alcohol dehydrogenase (NADP+)